MTHQQIDQRSLAMASNIVDRIDADPQRAGLERAKGTCQRWIQQSPSAAVYEWMEILQRPWEEVRQVLLDESEKGQRRRQSNPFCGVLTPRERWEIYRSFHEEG
jgi:hypothetical protein